MYSVVLMMAISGGAEAPDFGRCGGCSSSCSSSCHGARTCHGGCHGGLFSRRCHGCSSSACHGSTAACTGSCHGSSSCHGCNGGGLFSRLFHRNRCHGCSTCAGTACTGGTTTPGTTKEMPKGGKGATSAPSASDVIAVDEATVVSDEARVVTAPISTVRPRLFGIFRR